MIFCLNNVEKTAPPSCFMSTTVTPGRGRLSIRSGSDSSVNLPSTAFW